MSQGYRQYIPASRSKGLARPLLILIQGNIPRELSLFGANSPDGNPGPHDWGHTKFFLYINSAASSQPFRARVGTPPPVLMIDLLLFLTYLLTHGKARPGHKGLGQQISLEIKTKDQTPHAARVESEWGKMVHCATWTQWDVQDQIGQQSTLPSQLCMSVMDFFNSLGTKCHAARPSRMHARDRSIALRWR